MKISCSYCGMIHEKSYICDKKRGRTRNYYRHANDNIKKKERFRNSKEYKKARLNVLDRDSYCCQICIRELYNTKRKYNYKNISTHHIESLEEEWELRSEEDNLITLCREHHKMADDGSISKKLLKQIVKEQNEKLEKSYSPC